MNRSDQIPSSRTSHSAEKALFAKSKKIRILMLEDCTEDTELLLYELRRSGFDFTSKTVQTRQDFENELIHFNPELILSDYSLPSFNGLSAFQLKQEIAPDTPFMIVSGTIGDENAVELIKSGVTDYVLKEKIYQIAPKIIRALKETNERREKKLAEENLRQSREQLQRIMDQSLDLICAVNNEGTFLNVSAASLTILGYRPDELIGRKAWEFIHPEDFKKTLELSESVFGGIEVRYYENRYLAKDGRIVWLFWTAKWDANEMVAYCVARDATEKKQAETLVKNSEKRFKALLENSTDGLTILNQEGVILEVSESGQKILGYKADTLTGISAFAIIHPEDQVEVKKAFENVIIHPDNIITLEYRSLLPGGTYRWIELNFQNLLQEPAVGAIIAHYRDITERKLSQIIIRESEEKYRTLFDMSPFPMWLFDVETFRFLNVNYAAIKHYGYSREEFMAMSIKDIRPPEDVQKVEEIVTETKKTGVFSQGVFTHVKKNGERIFVDIQSNLIELDGVKARLVLATDISKRILYIQDIEEKNKRLKEIAWIQSHVVRAPLARIKGLIDLLKHLPDEEIELPELLNNIIISADELDTIIHEIVKKTERLEN